MLAEPEELVMEQDHTMEPFLLSLCSYSGCCIHRLSLNTARHAQSLLEASQGIAKQSHHASGTKWMFTTLQPCKPPSDYKMLSQMIQYVRPHYIVYDPLCFCCLAQTSPLKHNCYLCTKVRTLRLSFLAVFYNCCHGSWLSDLRTNLYENLTYIPHVACSYHIKLQIGLFASKWDHPYSSTLCWLRCSLAFFLLHSAIQSIRGARSSCGHAIKTPTVVDLVNVESNISPDVQLMNTNSSLSFFLFLPVHHESCMVLYLFCILLLVYILITFWLDVITPRSL